MFAERAKDPKMGQNHKDAKRLLKVQNLAKQGGEIGYIGFCTRVIATGAS
jgi:hypothetical protein